MNGLPRWVLAILPLAVALLLQVFLGHLFRPFVWFLFYPAIFLASWVGGLRAAIVLSALTAAAVFWFFVPPVHSFHSSPGQYFATAIFFMTGILFGIFHELLRGANRRLAGTLGASEQANESLKKAVNDRRIFEALIDASSDFIGIADAEGKPWYVNPAGRRMVGLAQDQRVEDTRIIDYYPADRRSFARDVIVRSMVENGQWQGETEFRNFRTEEAIPVSDTHFVIRDPENREVLGMGTVTRDISVLKEARDEADRARRQIQEAQDAVASLVELAPDGVFVADLDGRYLQVNNAACRMSGYTRGEILGKTILDLIPADRIEQLEREKSQLLRHGPLVSEWMLRRKDGSLLPVEISARILPDGRWQAFVRDISARKVHEEALREAQERLELTLRGADLAAWDWNIQSGEVVFNARWAEMRGYRPDEIRGHEDSWFSGIHPEDLPHVREVLDAYLEGRAPEYEAELRVRTKSGGWIWILDRGKVFARDRDGRPIRMVGTEIDITGRKRADEELRLAEAKASGIVSVSADAIISIDDGGRITLFNEGAETIFGYSNEEAMGAPLEMLMPAQFRSAQRRLVEGFAAGRAVARRMAEPGTTFWGLRKSGEAFPADATMSKLEVNGTRILTLALRDVTDQKRLEEEQRFLAELGSVLSSTLDVQTTLTSIGRLATRELADACIVYLLEAGGRVRRLKAILRDPALEWIGDALMQVPVDRGSWVPEIWSELEANRSVLVEHMSPEMLERFSRSEEHLRTLRALGPRSLIALPLHAHRKLVGAMALISTSPQRIYGPPDVHLAEQVAQRAAFALDNAQLYGEAQRAIRDRDDVLGLVAHDLRNPLGTIQVQASLLRRGGISEPTSRSAEVIERSAKRMNRLIQDLLDVTRMEEGMLPIHQSSVSASEAILECVESQEPLAEAASVGLAIEVEGDLPEIWADRDRLRQIFENLVGNALKFTPAGGRVTVGAAPQGGEVLFWVADTGVGISDENLPHLFDRFWQVRKDERRGAGLGLPIVKGLVKAHGGRVWVESELGRGTTFFLTIPTIPAGSPDEAHAWPG